MFFFFFFFFFLIARQGLQESPHRDNHTVGAGKTGNTFERGKEYSEKVFVIIKRIFIQMDEPREDLTYGRKAVLGR